MQTVPIPLDLLRQLIEAAEQNGSEEAADLATRARAYLTETGATVDVPVIGQIQA